jgi:hypothetical protein
LCNCNTKLFDYKREVIVELHTRTTTGEFEVVSYTFTEGPDTVGRNFVESRVTFSRSPVRIQPGECHDVTQSYVRQYENERELQHPDIPSEHEGVVTDVLDETEYRLA